MRKSGTPKRRNQIREENERRILKAAVEVFAEDGYQGATTKKIAWVAGLPKANLHYYFQTKEHLYRRVLNSFFIDWMSAANTFDECEDPAEALSSMYAQSEDVA